MYGKRKIFKFKCNITSHLSTLIDKIAAEEDKCCSNSEQISNEKIEKIEKIEKLDKFDKIEKFDKNSQYRLISSNVFLSLKCYFIFTYFLYFYETEIKIKNNKTYNYSYNFQRVILKSLM